MKKIIKFCQKNNLIFSINTNAMNDVYVIFDFVSYHHRQNRHYVTIPSEDIKNMSNSAIEKYILSELGKFYRDEKGG